MIFVVAQFYDGTKLLSMKDLDGNTPEIFMCTTNRNGGKTTYFGRYMVNRYMRYGEKFMLLYRFNYELDDCADKFFKDIGSLFFQDHRMVAKKKAGGIFCELYMDDKSCGYAVALNNADQLKKYSHLFSDTTRMLFDEFQSETNHYCPDEVKKFQSVHTSVARGQGQQIRYVPVYMLGNTVSIINPYYVAMGVSNRLKDDTLFLRGNGYVLEQGFVETASRAQQSSGFNKAFANSDYNNYASQGVYLNDNKAFIERPTGYGRYLATLKYNGTEYGLREFPSLGIIYCDDRPDTGFKTKISVTTEDHNVNYVMLKSNDMFISAMRYFFDRGCFRFKNLNSKEALLTALSY